METVETLEIGPGTGQATADLLRRGARVTAVEIGPNLAAFLRRKFDGDARLQVITGAFEEVDLPSGAFDLVFAATSFHWLEPTIRMQRAHDLLSPNGTLAVLQTVQIQSDTDAGYFEHTTPIYRRWGQKEDPPRLTREDQVVPAEFEEFRSSALFEDVRFWRYRWDQVYPTDSYEDLLRSYSVTQAMEPEAREGLISDLKAIINDEYGGRVVRPLVITLTVGRRSP